MRNKIFIYNARIFLSRFVLAALAFTLLFFMINFIENSAKFIDQQGMTAVILEMSILNTPHFLTGIANSIILMASILATHALSIRSEMVIMRSGGLSLWTIIRPMILAAFLLGVFWVLIFDPISIVAKKKFFDLDKKFVESELRDAIEPDSGIWLKQDNQEILFENVGNKYQSPPSPISKQPKPNLENANPIILILAQKIYQDSLQFGDISFWFFDKNQTFYKKVDADFAELKGKIWHVRRAIINDESLINSKVEDLEITTNLDEEFVRQKIMNDLKTADIYSIFELKALIEEMSNSGLNNVKFKVRMNTLLSMPVLFSAMVMIGAFFGINHTRNGKSSLMIFLGLICGLTIYIASSIIGALGSSGALSVFASTWTVAIIILSIGILAIYSKEDR